MGFIVNILLALKVLCPRRSSNLEKDNFCTAHHCETRLFWFLTGWNFSKKLTTEIPLLLKKINTLNRHPYSGLVVFIHQMTLTLINLAVLSCVGMGWFGILRNSEFEAVLNKTERS